MNVLGVSGSLRKNGNTSYLVNVILNRCADAGLTTEFVSLAGKEIRPCLGCEKCKEQNWCINERDDWDDVIRKVMECEVLLIGSPTYYYDVSGQLKNFIDRSYSLYHKRQLAGRMAVAVAVHANKGAARTIQTIEGFLSAHEFSYLGHVQGKGYLEGEVRGDESAVRKAEKIGDKIVKILRPHD
jgi:multimeric flavodoxin WrbA